MPLSQENPFRKEIASVRGLNDELNDPGITSERRDVLLKALQMATDFSRYCAHHKVSNFRLDEGGHVTWAPRTL